VEDIHSIAEKGFVLIVGLEKLRSFVNQAGVTGFELLTAKKLSINNKFNSKILYIIA
jgi:hypothetical protein